MNNKMNNKWTTGEQQVNTNKKEKKEKKERKIYSLPDFSENELKGLYEN